MKVYENYKKVETALSKTSFTINDYKQLLNSMKDEKSKIISYYRIMIDNIDDAYYGLQLVLSSYINDYYRNNSDKQMYYFINFLLKNNNYNKDIYLIGVNKDLCLPRGIVWHSWKPLNIKYIFDDGKWNVEKFDCTGGVYSNIADLSELKKLKPNSFKKDDIFIIARPNLRMYKDFLINKLKINSDNIFAFNTIPLYQRNEQYFIETFFPIKDDEIYMDCGSYDFDSIFSFINWSFNSYKKIYAIEPLKEYYDTYEEIIKTKKIKNIETYNVGLWKCKGTQKFKLSVNGDSRISTEGATTLEVDTIDNILNGREVTLIKFDIEGAEYEAILGAEKTIKKYKPKIVASIYHKRNDIFQIAKLLLSYNKDYEVYVRHNEFCMYETNMYFIDKNQE